MKTVVLSFSLFYDKLKQRGNIMIENIEVLSHACIKIKKEKIIYTDPFQLKIEDHDADIILITHSHFDHFSEEDLKKVTNENTIICVPKDLFDNTLAIGFKKENIVIVEPNRSYEVLGIKIETIPAYNIDKPFHPKENNWVGYIVVLQDYRYFIAGDTDATEENKKIHCDVAFVPVGGTYTMDAQQADDFINTIQPKIAIPIHYGSIVGKKEDALNFVQNLDSKIIGKILMKGEMA